MLEKCIRCGHLGKDCIPNLCALPLEDVNRWAIKLKAYKRITNAELADRSGVPKGTIDAHFSRKKDHSPDVNYSTFAPILCALIGCSDIQCPKEKLDGNTESVEHVIKESQKKIDFLKDELKTERRRLAEMKKALVIVFMLFAASVLLIIISLLLDRYDPSIGFFWRT